MLRHGGCFFPLLVNKFPFGSFTVRKDYNKKEDTRKLALLYNQLLNLFIVYCVVGNTCAFSIHINWVLQCFVPFLGISSSESLTCYTEAPSLFSRLLAHFLRFPGGCLQLGLSAKSWSGHFSSCSKVQQPLPITFQEFMEEKLRTAVLCQQYY